MIDDFFDFNSTRTYQIPESQSKRRPTNVVKPQKPEQHEEDELDYASRYKAQSNLCIAKVNKFI